MIRSLLREPLVHFLAAGAAIWLGLTLWGEPVDPASRTIEVTREQQAGMAIGFERMMGRAPTDAELATLIDSHVREEVLYREALRLGIDRDDAVVRRRLATKMDELATAEAQTRSVDDRTLQQWLASHPERFAAQTVLSFDQYSTGSREGAEAMLAQARGGGQPAYRSRPIDLPNKVESMREAEVRNRFGQQFMTGLARLEPGTGWQGPIPSGLGWHIVRLRGRRAQGVPPFATIRDEVENDWRNATISERRQRGYDLLRAAYSVKVAQ